MGQCLVMTYELVCNEVLRKFQEYHRDKSGVHGTRSSHQDPFRSQDDSRVSKPGHLGGHRTNSIYEAMKAENHRMTEELITFIIPQSTLIQPSLVSPQPLKEHK